jgi:hypothetical protein
MSPDDLTAGPFRVDEDGTCWELIPDDDDEPDEVCHGPIDDLRVTRFAAHDRPHLERLVAEWDAMRLEARWGERDEQMAAWAETRGRI